MNGSATSSGPRSTAEVTAEPVNLEGFEQVDLYQHREKIYTRFVGGFFQKLRFFTGWPLLVGYFLTPWLVWDGRQAVLFDLSTRQFHLFDLTLWPQDLWLLGWLLMIAAFGLFTATTLVGRLWCGYTCPQTVWTAIFMWAEQLTEGSRNARMRLDAAPMSFSKLRKRVSKHTLWLGWAFLTGLTFVGYFVPIRELTVAIGQLDVLHWSGFWVAFFTAATYINAGWLREQVCIYMCPYARFQSAMIDRDTLIVSYDRARGEPRGSRKRTDTNSDLGDCVDCQLCVQVCPTGIDIRDGLQYQCIQCAHCIDACNSIMERMGYAPDLIAYRSENELAGGRFRWMRGRSIGYAIVLSVMGIALLVGLSTRGGTNVEVLRERDALFQPVGHDQFRNDYQLKLLNKGSVAREYNIRLADAPQLSITSVQAVELAALEALNLPLQIVGPAVPAGSIAVTVEVCEREAAGARCASEETRFITPRPPQTTGASER